MHIIQKLRLWFYTRKQIMDEVQSLTEMLDIQMSKYLPQIVALEQDKIYVMSAEDATPNDIIAMRKYLNELDQRLKWTAPHIILINKKIRKLTKEELKIITKEIGANRVQIHNKT